MSPSPKITLYVFPPSQNAVRPELALLEKGLPFEKVELDLLAGEHRKPPLSEVAPRMQVPTLVHERGDERLVLYESIAIIRFLDDVHPEPPLMPPLSDLPRRAQALMRIEEFQAKLDGKNIFGSVVFRKQTREQLGERVDNLVAELNHWNRYAEEGGTFLAGDHFTLADIAVFPLLMHFEVLGFDYGTHTPALAAYLDRCKARPSVAKSGWVERLRQFVASREARPVLAEI